jgi:hypothetical protein
VVEMEGDADLTVLRTRRSAHEMRWAANIRHTRYWTKLRKLHLIDKFISFSLPFRNPFATAI